jgi:LppX/LprAFG-like lipoprotein
MRIPAALVVLLVASCGSSQAPSVDAARALRDGGAAMATLQTVTATLKVTKGTISLQGYALASAVTAVRMPADSDTVYTVKEQDLSITIEVLITGGKVYVHLPFSNLAPASPADAAVFPDLARLFNPSSGLPAVIPAGSGTRYIDTEQVSGRSAYRISTTYTSAQVHSMLAQLSSSGDVHADIWVDAGDHLVRKAVLDGAFGDGGQDARIEVDITSFNGAVTIASPPPA